MEPLARIGVQLPPFLQPSPPPSAANDSPPSASNRSASGSGPGLPFPSGINIMDSFLASAGQASPLLQLILFVYRQLGTQLGLDPSVVLTVFAFLWGLSKMGSQMYAHLSGFVDRYFMCAMYVSEYDHIYEQLMKWLSQQQSIRSSRYLMAQTVWRSAWDDEDEPESSLYWTDADGGADADAAPKYLNFSNQAARSGPRYVPAMGVTSFWHKGTLFRVYRRKESLINTSGWGPMKDLEEIKISCLGRSIEPIKRLLAEAKMAYYHDTYRKTTIYRPKPKELRHDNSMWQQVARRPVRPMSTVVLDSREKHGVLADVNEYLHPATPRWYASRGIPLRRGYLFHGPPGTGKTSFSFALAGVFGIDIYVISLQDVNVTEEDLAALFTRLPRRCIVLLEDIDTAGLRRDTDDSDVEQDAEEENKGVLANGEEKQSKMDAKDKDEAKKKKKKSKKKDEDESSEDEDTGVSDSEHVRKASSKKRKSKARRVKAIKTGASGRNGGGGGSSSSSNSKVVALDSISLSGLLNAIDGVASHEGRVLIMTTNKPEALDEALIRPGRVDVQVAFVNASSAQAVELFRRMYEAAPPRRQKETAARHEGGAEPGAKQPSTTTRAGEAQAEAEAEAEAAEKGVSSERMQAVADEFGRQIPGAMFSPAEIQGFLLKRKRSPLKALEEVEAWVEASAKQKEAKSKVSTVQ